MAGARLLLGTPFFAVGAALVLLGRWIAGRDYV